MLLKRSTAFSTYNRLMFEVCEGIIALIRLAHLDKVILFSTKKSNHITFREVFDRLRLATLKLMLIKVFA